MKWTNDIVVRLEAAVEDLDVLSVCRLEMLLREAASTILTLRGLGGGASGADGQRGGEGA